MRLDLSDDQALLAGSLDQLLKTYGVVPHDKPTYVKYNGDLQQELIASGFLGISAAEGFGPLEAALVIEAVARSPWSVEVAASALVGPVLGVEASPLALCEGVGRATRYLADARHVVIRDEGRLLHAPLQPGEAERVESVLAYPLGRVAAVPARATALDEATAAKVDLMWRLGLAIEAAGLMRGALDLTVGHVKDRRQFGQPLGDFQAIQHRLAMDEQLISASYLLALRAAESQSEADVATALLYVQENMRRVIYDCHQFCGAMGLTLEYSLHLWTYRLKAIQGELGGRAAQAHRAAESVF